MGSNMRVHIISNIPNNNPHYNMRLNSETFVIFEFARCENGKFAAVYFGAAAQHRDRAVMCP